MRIFAPVQTIYRITTKDVIIGDYKIPEGTKLCLDFGSVHYSEEFFEKPFEYNPERWMNKPSNPYLWLPFSAGPRMCKKIF